MQLTRDGNSPPGDNQFYSTFTGPVVYTDKQKFQKVDFGSIDKNKTDHEKSAEDGWVGIIQHYFMSAWLPTDKAPREYFTRKIADNLYSVGALQPLGELAPGATSTVQTRLIAAPQDQRMLEKIAPGLDLAVDYGWLTVVASRSSGCSRRCTGSSTTGLGDRAADDRHQDAVLPAAGRQLQVDGAHEGRDAADDADPRTLRQRPRQDEPGDDGAVPRREDQPARRLPAIVVQIPVFIALYWVLLASVEMRNAPWIGWIQDLAAPDPLYILPLIMAATMSCRPS